MTPTNPHPERDADLDQAAGDDPSLQSPIEARLPTDDEAGVSTVSRPSLQVTVPASQLPGPASGPRAVPGEELGSSVGPYRLLQRIGEGGMGAVFLAEQVRPIRRKVALKVIKPGMDTAQVIGRFEAERQALAMMNHPNIARVLDAGATDAGRPFFVMELVRGIPITEYADRNHLTPRERLELFVPVCRAIQHAHQKGVVHRDIKPSNVLVTVHNGVPEPKVIDFGVAKAIEHRLTERTMFTEFGAVIGTLEYMSPEQAEMGPLDVDTRSDIYSLGVLLYELLTGSTPLEKAKLREAAYSEVLRRIREEEPPKPSTRLSESKEALPTISARRKTEPARLPKLIRGDLDWIVMKALDKDRTGRYETAVGFARDIQHHLDGDPVEAGPPSHSYRLKKFARKHRVALATAAAFAGLLAGATVVSADFASRANTARDHADRQRLKAVAAECASADQRDQARADLDMAIDAVRYHADLIRQSPELKGDPRLDPLRKALLRRSLAFFERLRDRLNASKAPTTDSLVRLATASTDMADLNHEIGDNPEALRLHQESRTIRERLAHADPTNARLQHELAANYGAIGTLLSQTGREDEASALFARARTIRDRLPHARATSGENRQHPAERCRRIGPAVSGADQDGPDGCTGCDPEGARL